MHYSLLYLKHENALYLLWGVVHYTFFLNNPLVNHYICPLQSNYPLVSTMCACVNTDN